jgi:uncharacterized protein YxeA
MVKYWTKFLIYIFCFGFFSINAQDKSVYGNVTDPVTNKGVIDITILNTRSSEVVGTNPKGDFYIRARAGDSILIQSYGYNRAGIKWDGKNKNVQFFAKQEATMLQELIVIEKSTAELNKEILAFLNNPQDGKAIKNEILKNMVSGLDARTTQPGLGISIDGLYNMFSKEGKMHRNLADLMTQDARKFYVNLKYNKNMVTSITKLDEDDVVLFMRFCKPNEDFILLATDYDLTKRILACLSDFRYRKINGSLREFIDNK